MGILSDNKNKLQYVENKLNDIKSKLETTEEDEAKEYVEWLDVKTDMRVSGEIPNFPIFKKGIYYINFGKNIGSEQEKDRPAVVLWGTKNSDVIVVAPISDERKYDGSTFWFHVHLSSGDTLLLEQIRTVSKRRVRRPVYVSGKIRELLEDEQKKANSAINKLKFFIQN